MTDLDRLLKRFKAVAEQTGVTPEVLSRRILGRTGRIEDYRQGKFSPSIRTIAKVNSELDKIEKDQRAAKAKPPTVRKRKRRTAKPAGRARASKITSADHAA